jgi:hypothetical protein
MLAGLLAMGTATRVRGQDSVKPNILDGASVDVLTNGRTDMIQGRMEFPANNMWSVGALADYFTRGNPDDSGQRWGVGGFTKLKVDPDASVPLANWFPAIGEWLSLPESLTGETYLIGIGEVLPYEDGIDLALSVGPGLRVGPVLVEYGYRLVESGDADNPALSSKAGFRLGAKPITSIWPLRFLK